MSSHRASRPPASGTPASDDSAARISPAAVVLVFIGGALGTLLRFAAQRGCETVFAHFWGSSGSALAQAAWVLPVNLLGAFLLALLYTAVPPGVLSAWAKPLLGTGLLGGFTSYSTLALDLLSLSERSWMGCVLYAVLSLVGGLGCAVLGAFCGQHLADAELLRRQGPQSSPRRRGARW